MPFMLARTLPLSLRVLQHRLPGTPGFCPCQVGSHQFDQEIGWNMKDPFHEQMFFTPPAQGLGKAVDSKTFPGFLSGATRIREPESIH